MSTNQLLREQVAKEYPLIDCLDCARECRGSDKLPCPYQLEMADQILALSPLRELLALLDQAEGDVSRLAVLPPPEPEGHNYVHNRKIDGVLVYDKFCPECRKVKGRNENH